LLHAPLLARYHPGIMAVVLPMINVPSLLDISSNVLSEHLDRYPDLDRLPRLLKHLVWEKVRRSPESLTSRKLDIFVGADVDTFVFEDCSSILDPCIMHVASHCEKLVTINLAGCWNIMDVSILCVLQSCPLLKHMNLAECASLTDCSLQHLSESSCRLYTLNLNLLMKMSNVSLCKYIENAGSSLKALHLSYWHWNLLDSAVSVIGNVCRDLELFECEYCWKITTLCPLLGCPSLDSIHCSGTRALRTQDMLEFVQARQGKRTAVWRSFQCPWLSNDIVKCIADDNMSVIDMGNFGTCRFGKLLEEHEGLLQKWSACRWTELSLHNSLLSSDRLGNLWKNSAHSLRILKLYGEQLLEPEINAIALKFPLLIDVSLTYCSLADNKDNLDDNSGSGVRSSIYRLENEKFRLQKLNVAHIWPAPTTEDIVRLLTSSYTASSLKELTISLSVHISMQCSALLMESFPALRLAH
jgi:hypothetical protein